MYRARLVKTDVEQNDLIERIKADPAFRAVHDKIDSVLAPENFTGRAEQQTEIFIRNEIQPVLDANKAYLGIEAEINV